MKRVLNLMRQDLATALRDNIIVYIIMGPLLLALAFKSFIPAAESSRLVFAVDRHVHQDVVERIRGYGRVELYDLPGVRARVARLDTVAGVVDDGGRLSLLFEGNEPRPLIEAYRILLEDIGRNGPAAVYESRSLGAGRSIIFDLFALMLIMSTVFLSGVVSGFNIVDEKDSRAVQALAVSPIRLAEYVAARGLLATVLTVVSAIAASYIMVGPTVAPFNLLAVLILSAGLTTLVGLLIGIFSHNQISAVAVLKVAMPFFLFLPFGALFVPQKLQFLFYPLPNYWQLEALKTLYAPSLPRHGFWLSSLMTLATSGVFLVLAAGILRRRLRLRH